MSKELPVEGTNTKKVPDEFDVVVNGVIVGRDPDANIRESIRTEYLNRNGGSE